MAMGRMKRGRTLEWIEIPGRFNAVGAIIDRRTLPMLERLYLVGYDLRTLLRACYTQGLIDG